MSEPEKKQLPMVRWFDPSQLIQTAGQVFISAIFGRHSDFRLMEATTPTTNPFVDYTKYEDETPRNEIWIDYVADTGDGWNSTYSIAYYVAQAKLIVEDSLKQKHQTERGNILVFGGDEVYPTPSRKEYEERLLNPYETALPQTTSPHPDVFAIPGNHDWYDSLVSFTRIFCAKEWFAGWKAPQQRSYFALKLPHGWWLIGTDIQLDSDIDKPQVEYFKTVKKAMGDEDRVILCNAEPHWIFEKLYGKEGSLYSKNNLNFLEEKVFGRKVAVFIAGDLHHYRRHATEDLRQKITAGGGGAFLHPTHGQNVDLLNGGYTLKSSFPDPETSKRLCWRNVMFPFLNRTFGVIPAIFYLLTAWSVMADIGYDGTHEIGHAVTTTLRATLGSPVAAFWGLAIFFGFVVFTETHSKGYRWIMGSIHGLIHITAAFFLGWGAAYFSVSVLGLDFKSIPQLLLSGPLIFIGGWVVGSFIMGIYLLVSLNLFGRHSNEAFSSLGIEDWKHFLRFKIDASGTLTIFPIGIQRVARKWKDAPAGTTGSKLEPDDASATPPSLIEDPVVLYRPMKTKR